MIARNRSMLGSGLPLAFAVLIGLVAFPQAASATTASLSGGVLTITGGAGEANTVVLTTGNGAPLWVEDPVGVTPGVGCVQGSVSTRAICSLGTAGISSASVVVSLGDGNDSFNGDGASSYVTTITADGGPGDDTIVGGGSKDVIRGGDGNDDLGGSSGEDQVLGEAGDDTVRGQAGADTVSGGPGLDLIEGDGQGIYGNGGSDTIDSRDGERDRVTCGLGADFVTADVLDVIETSECESVDKPSGSGPDPGTTTPAALAIAFVASPSAKLSKLATKAGPTFRFSISAPCTAGVKLSISAGEARRTHLGRSAVTLLSDRAAVPDAGTFEGTLGLPAKYRRKLRAVKRLTTTLALSCTAAGKTARVSKTITFKR